MQPGARTFVEKNDVGPEAVAPGTRQACSRHGGIVGEKFIFRLAGRKKFEYEFTSPIDKTAARLANPVQYACPKVASLQSLHALLHTAPGPGYDKTRDGKHPQTDGASKFPHQSAAKPSSGSDCPLKP
jgi:hypothetical protein